MPTENDTHMAEPRRHLGTGDDRHRHTTGRQEQDSRAMVMTPVVPGPIDPVIDLRDVAKTYQTPAGAFTALERVSLSVLPGEYLAIVGKVR